MAEMISNDGLNEDDDRTELVGFKLTPNEKKLFDEFWKDKEFKNASRFIRYCINKEMRGVNTDGV